MSSAKPTIKQRVNMGPQARPCSGIQPTQEAGRQGYLAGKLSCRLALVGLVSGLI